MQVGEKWPRIAADGAFAGFGAGSVLQTWNRECYGARENKTVRDVLWNSGGAPVCHSLASPGMISRERVAKDFRRNPFTHLTSTREEVVS